MSTGSWSRHLAVTATTALLFCAPAQASDPTTQAALADLALKHACNYCIAASETGMARKDGVFVPLTRMQLSDLPTDHNTLDQNLHGNHTPQAHHFPALGPLSPKWSNGLATYRATYTRTSKAGKTRKHALFVPYVRPNPALGTTWTGRVSTASVCVGSQFELPTHFFAGADGAPFAPPPGVNHVPPSAHAAELPGSKTQRICEGALMPIADFIKIYVRDETRAALKEMRDSLSKAEIEKTIQQATATWLDNNRAQLAREAAALVERGQ